MQGGSVLYSEGGAGERVSTGVGKRDDPEGDTVEVAKLGW